MAVLSDILDITRIESGDVELNETVIAPDYMVKSALRLISARSLLYNSDAPDES